MGDSEAFVAVALLPHWLTSHDEVLLHLSCWRPSSLADFHDEDQPHWLTVVPACSQAVVSHQDTNQAQFCLTSIFEWKLVYPLFNSQWPLADKPSKTFK